MHKRWRKVLPRRVWWWLLEREMRREYPEKIKRARAAGDKEKVASLEHDYQFNLRDITESKLDRIQRKIVRKARRLMIPVPSPDINKMAEHGEDDNWYHGVSEFLLKDETVIKLRREIRAEQRERFDSYARWITLIVGLIGAATGLVAVWFK